VTAARSIVLAIAQAAAAASPSPAPSPAVVPNPCGSILSIVTRPTVTTSVCTVQTGRVLVENGYTNTVTTGPGGGVTVAYPQSLLRIGTADPKFELDATPPSFERSSLAGATIGGSSDVGLGAKYELGYSKRWLYGVNAAITYPTGTQTFSAGDTEFTGSFNWSYTVNSCVGIAGATSFNALSGLNSVGSAQSYFAFIPSLVVTASLPGPSEFFGEYAYFSQAGVGLGGKSLIDLGYVRDLGEHVQLDVEYGFSPTVLAGQKQHYVGAGASFMF
jgi:hypothetical protein